MELRQNERLDDLNINNLKIIQNEKIYCFNSDSVLLADFAVTKPTDIVCDFGTGSGVIPILLMGKRQLKHIYAIEVQDVFIDIAKRNFEMNGMGKDITLIEGNIKNVVSCLMEKGINVVVCNPPYFDQTTPLKNEREETKIARHEILIDLEQIIYCASKLLQTGGRFYFVHKVKRLNPIYEYLNKYKLKAKKIRFVYPKADKEADLCLMECIKDKNPETIVMPPLYVRKQNGDYTDEVKLIYGREVK